MWESTKEGDQQNPTAGTRQRPSSVAERLSIWETGEVNLGGYPRSSKEGGAHMSSPAPQLRLPAAQSQKAEMTRDEWGK